MTYWETLSQAMDALLVLEERAETDREIKALCAIARDALCDRLIRVERERFPRRRTR